MSRTDILLTVDDIEKLLSGEMVKIQMLAGYNSIDLCMDEDYLANSKALQDNKTGVVNYIDKLLVYFLNEYECSVTREPHSGDVNEDYILSMKFILSYKTDNDQKIKYIVKVLRNTLIENHLKIETLIEYRTDNTNKSYIEIDAYKMICNFHIEVIEPLIEKNILLNKNAYL